MDRKRRAVAGATAAIAVGAAGCVGFVTGSEPLREEAKRTTVSEDALSETGFQEDEIEEVVIDEEIAADREVEVTNWLATYEKAAELAGQSMEVGQFAVVSTPQFEILGRAMNPIDQLDNEELLEEFLAEYDDLSVDGKADSESVETLGTEVDVDRFDGVGTLAGQEFDLDLHITRVEVDDDFVIALGVHPEELPEFRDDIHRLIEGLER